MAYDKARPISTNVLRKSAGNLRDNFSALETALSEGHDFTTSGEQTGKHTTPTFADNGGAPSAPSGSNEFKLYNDSGLLSAINNSGTTTSVGIPSGTKMLFMQNTVPTGWTFDSSNNDRVILNTSTQSEGGSTGGGWTITGINSSGHTLTEAELPNISGSVRFYGGVGSFNDDKIIQSTSGNFSSADSNEYDTYISIDDFDATTTTSTELSFGFGSGNAHTHSLDSTGEWRPAYVKSITCQKV